MIQTRGAGALALSHARETSAETGRGCLRGVFAAGSRGTRKSGYFRGFSGIPDADALHFQIAPGAC